MVQIELAIISYLLGSINFAYLIGKLMKIDISKVHDQNLGAYNLYRTTNSIKLFILAGLLDALKAFIPTYFFGTIYGVFAIMGHVFSILSFLKTKRLITGMGIASTIGFFVAFDYKLLLIYVILILLHKLAISKMVENKIRVFGKQLYQLMYFYLAILLYSTVFYPNQNEFIVLSSILILLTIGFEYRWITFVRRRVLPNIQTKELRKIMEEK